jgi:hypothetical protein
MTSRSLRQVRPALLLALAPLVLGAQVTPPVGKAPINAARTAVQKTNEQTKAAERVGGTTQKAAPAPTQKAGTAPTQKAAGRGAPQGRSGGRPDTASGTVVQAGARRNQVVVMRETFSYGAGGRRDPFVSLMATGELRPILTDLVLTGVVFDDERGRRSIALLVDVSTGQSYRVRVGQTLGRMTVTRISREDITFSIDEFGLSRSETLSIDKSSKAGAAPATRRP